jgi:hypothetical protein
MEVNRAGRNTQEYFKKCDGYYVENGLNIWLEEADEDTDFDSYATLFEAPFHPVFVLFN